jgi:glycosyltransferase involved in cell wall biosynthesis
MVERPLSGTSPCPALGTLRGKPPHGGSRSLTAPVSVVVITRNEEANIGRCLASVRWAAEVIVVDAESSDCTAKIAGQSGARVLNREWSGFSPQKNFGIEQATQPWVFSLDADEVVTPALAKEIEKTLLQPQYNAYRLFRPTYFMGRALRHYGRGAEPGHLRLFRRWAGRFDSRLVHESVRVAGPIGTLRAPLLHYSYPSVRSYWRKIHQYAPLEAQERLLNGSPRGGRWVRGLGKFGWMLILRHGIIDGPHAWIWIAGQAYQEWLATGQTARLRSRGAHHAAA